MTRASGGNLARTPGLHPTLYEKCHGIFNDHRESGPRFNVSSERRRIERNVTIEQMFMKLENYVQNCLPFTLYCEILSPKLKQVQ